MRSGIHLGGLGDHRFSKRSAVDELHTSVHDPLGMHVVKGRTQLHKVLPDGPLWNESLLLLEVADHA